MSDTLPEKTAREQGEIILYQTEDGGTRIEVRMVDETVWMTQKLLAELYQKDVRTINEHIQNILAERELSPKATIRKFRIVQSEGKREVARQVDCYSLDMIFAVGYRVRSHRGAQFRQWATERLKEYLVKGFALDDERLKRAGGGGYFEELLARIRDIRASEKLFWRKVLDIYATSIDSELSRRLHAVAVNEKRLTTSDQRS
ncbi:MAG: virulence RhuM family protein [Deltaproteobacteria bacterium]|nr:virulence RhuM family protein [Deltaproteobacteria bacterium]